MNMTCLMMSRSGLRHSHPRPPEVLCHTEREGRSHETRSLLAHNKTKSNPSGPVAGYRGVHSACVFVLPPCDRDAVDDRGVELNALDMFFFGSQPYAREELRNEEGDLSSSHLVEEVRGREILHR